MTDAFGAFTLLISRTVRNRIVRQAARLRNPRYALAIVIGVVYFWFAFARQSMAPERTNPDVRHAVNSVFEAILSIGLALTVLLYWLGIGIKGALAFQPAEVGLLFPAPVSRRVLIGYKVARSQLLLVVSCVIWAFLIKRWGVPLNAVMRYATAWGVLSVLSLHRFGAALMQIPTARGPRWVVWIPRALAVTAIAALLLGILRAVTGFNQPDFDGAIKVIGAALSAPPASVALTPFRLVLAPLYAASTPAWLASFAIVAGIVALHIIWVLSLDVEFEDAAAAATTALARRRAMFRERRAGGAAVVTRGKVKRGWLPLAPLGNPAVAITWKNTVALFRTGTLRPLIFIVVMLVFISRFMAGLGPGQDRAGAAAAVPMAVFAVMLFTLGPRMLRNDLRQDLLKLALLKSFPLRGYQLVAAEIASPALVLAVLQCTLIVVAFFMVPRGLFAAHGTAMTVLMLLAPLTLLALNTANVTVQNAITLLFPAWVRLGSDAGGVEVIGQNLLVVFGSLFALLLALLPPALVAGGVVLLVGFAFHALSEAAAVALGIAAAIVVLTGEIALLVQMLGGVFDRMDLSALG